MNLSRVVLKLYKMNIPTHVEISHYIKKVVMED